MELLEPLAIGARRARNRVVFGPHETNLGRGRAISDRHVAYYARRAAGGAGVVVTEEASVHPSDWPYERTPLASLCGAGWAAVAAACHAEGALAVAAIGHAGGQGSSAYSQAPVLAPSRVPDVNTREVPKAMEAHEIEAVVAGFAAAAGLAVTSGMDGVEIGAGQHSLVRQYLSGLTNSRTDAYGDDRARFAVEVITAVRDAAGPDACVGLRLSCDELAPWAGLTPDAGAALAARLAPLVDWITVVRGSIYTVSATRPDGHTEPGFNLDLTRSVRSAVAGACAVVLQGSVVDPAMAAAAVAGGDADAVEMTRAQIAEPDLVAHLAAGVPGRVRPCILCNQACMVRDNRNPIVSCVVEPSAGHETEDVPVPAEGSVATRRPEQLLVVGAGIAGLECARVAALAGHRPTVVESSDRTGGAAPVAATGAGRSRLAMIATWLDSECRRLGVRIETGRQVGPDDVAAWEGPVVICTGGAPGRHGYRVADAAVPVVDAAELLAATPDGSDGPVGAGLPDGPVAVYDPIGGPIGVSVAEALAAAGRDVQMLTPDLLVGTLLARSGDLAPANVRLQQAGVTLHRRVDLVEVTAEGPVVRDRYSAEERTVAASSLVDCGPRLPEDRLWRASGSDLPRAGDAVAPRSFYEAVLEGRRAALALELEGVAVP